MEDALEKLQSLSLKGVESPKPYLMVTDHPGSLSFSGHNLIGGFKITENQKYEKSLNIPRLIAASSVRKLEGTDLATGFDTATKISNYKAYHELKQDFFLKWLVEENYQKGVIEKKYKKSSIICFGGRITDPLMTPAITRFGDWKIYAAKFNDSIYLWDEKEGRDDVRFCDLGTYYGIYFEHLMTHPNPKATKVNEFDKVFAINEITFGSHQLLCLSELDAETENKEWAEIKVYRECSPKGMQGKYLKYWAQSIVPGVRVMAIGKHKNGRLQNIEMTTTDTMARKCGVREATCYHFQDRLLKFIQSHFTDNDPKVVKTFSWKDGDSQVRVEQVPQKFIPPLMLPTWYIDAVTAQTDLKEDDVVEKTDSKSKEHDLKDEAEGGCIDNVVKLTTQCELKEAAQELSAVATAKESPKAAAGAAADHCYDSEYDPLFSCEPEEYDPLFSYEPVEYDPLFSYEPVEYDPLFSYEPVEYDPLFSYEPEEYDPLFSYEPEEYDPLFSYDA